MAPYCSSVKSRATPRNGGKWPSTPPHTGEVRAAVRRRTGAWLTAGLREANQRSRRRLRVRACRTVHIPPPHACVWRGPIRLAGQIWQFPHGVSRHAPPQGRPPPPRGHSPGPLPTGAIPTPTQFLADAVSTGCQTCLRLTQCPTSYCPGHNTDPFQPCDQRSPVPRGLQTAWNGPPLGSRARPIPPLSRRFHILFCFTMVPP